MKSYVILEVFQIEIEQIIFSHFLNGTEKISPVVPILSGRSEKGKQTILILAPVILTWPHYIVPGKMIVILLHS